MRALFATCEGITIFDAERGARAVLKASISFDGSLPDGSYEAICAALEDIGDKNDGRVTDLWSDEIEAFVEAGFATVSRNPSDHETVVAYRTAIALALAAGTRRAETTGSAPKGCQSGPNESEGNAQ